MYQGMNPSQMFHKHIGQYSQTNLYNIQTTKHISNL
jgi:hypothetical protein